MHTHIKGSNNSRLVTFRLAMKFPHGFQELAYDVLAMSLEHLQHKIKREPHPNQLGLT
jgi:hypothetical protein